MNQGAEICRCGHSMSVHVGGCRAKTYGKTCTCEKFTKREESGGMTIAHLNTLRSLADAEAATEMLDEEGKGMKYPR